MPGADAATAPSSEVFSWSPDPCTQPTDLGRGGIEVYRLVPSALWTPPTAAVRAQFQVGSEELLSLVASDGACKAFSFESSVCDPPCAPRGICARNQQSSLPRCIPFGDSVSAGSLTILGLPSVSPLVVFPTEGPGGLYYHYSAGLKESLEEIPRGGIISVSVSGDVAPPADLAVAFVETLDPSWHLARVSRDPGSFLVVDVSGHEDISVSWSPGRPSDVVRLVLRSNNHAHGLPPVAEIRCEVPDDGILTVPRSILQYLPPTPRSAGAGTDAVESSIERLSCDRRDSSDWCVSLCASTRINFHLQYLP